MLQTCLPVLWGLQNEGASWLVLHDINCRSHETDCADHTGLFHGDDESEKEVITDITTQGVMSVSAQGCQVKKGALYAVKNPLYFSQRVGESC